MSRPTIAVVGSINSDLRLALPALPRPGETVLAHSYTREPGGKGANQAIAVVAAGADCQLIGAVGGDEIAESLVAAIAEAGVGTDHVHRVPDGPTGLAVVLVDDDGQNSIAVGSGANLHLSPELVVASLSALPALDAVLAQAEVPIATVTAAAELAAHRSVRFVLNLAPYTPVDTLLLSRCDPLVVNEVEAAQLVADLGRPTDDVADQLEILAAHCRSVMITLGSRGARWADARGRGEVAAERVEVVDTTGAGDAFVGAAAVALARGDVAAACRAGVAAGTRAVQWLGAQPAARQTSSARSS